MADGAKGSWDKVKNYFGLGETDSYDENYYEDDFDRGYAADHGSEFSHPESYGSPSRYGQSDSYSSRFSDSRPRTGFDRFNSDPDVVKFDLDNFLQIKEIVPEVAQQSVVILTMDALSPTDARRAVDIATGIALGQFGTLKTLPGPHRSYALLPETVDLSVRQLERLAEGR